MKWKAHKVFYTAISRNKLHEMSIDITAFAVNNIENKKFSDRLFPYACKIVV